MPRWNGEKPIDGLCVVCHERPVRPNRRECRRCSNKRLDVEHYPSRIQQRQRRNAAGYMATNVLLKKYRQEWLDLRKEFMRLDWEKVGEVEVPEHSRGIWKVHNAG
jgi:hypothetical protein